MNGTAATTANSRSASAVLTLAWRFATLRSQGLPVIPVLILLTVLFTAIFANVLVGNLAKHLHGVTLPHGFSSADATPALLNHLPAAVHAGFVAGYAESIQTVFLVAVPIAALAFLATWFIPQVELQRWAPAEAPSPAAGSRSTRSRTALTAVRSCKRWVALIVMPASGSSVKITVVARSEVLFADSPEPFTARTR